MAIDDALIAGKAVLLLDTLLLELTCLGFDFIVKNLYQLWFGVRRGIGYIVIAEDTEKLRISE